ncbi:MAG: SM-like, degradation of cytoplasmic mRNAs and positively regulates transcription initiation [Trizodia sp. TS-e1964]|nr:MAG: SM-like, degradation of cytoplasmic mRNAs and positively regulates transcription initiation [Trizodia sp. TS-e1964]
MDPSSHLPTPPPGAGASPAPPTQQLPPQMFTTAAQLLDLTDKKLMVSLRDGRKLIGVLRSWDQFANLVLQDTIERIFVAQIYADVPRGVFIVRGENVLLLGEIVGSILRACFVGEGGRLIARKDLDRDEYIPPPFQRAPIEEVVAVQRREAEGRKRAEKVRAARLKELGFECENHGEALI